MITDVLIDQVCELPRPECYEYMSEDEWKSSVMVMLSDLARLAQNDGCIAAAWALSMFEKQVSNLTAEAREEVEKAKRQLEIYRQPAKQIGDLFCWCVEHLKPFPPMKGEWIEEVKRHLSPAKFAPGTEWITNLGNHVKILGPAVRARVGVAVEMWPVEDIERIIAGPWRERKACE